MRKSLEMETITQTQTRHHETILIVEDDEPLLRLLRFFLELRRIGCSKVCTAGQENSDHRNTNQKAKQ